MKSIASDMAPDEDAISVLTIFTLSSVRELYS